MPFAPAPLPAVQSDVGRRGSEAARPPARCAPRRDRDHGSRPTPRRRPRPRRPSARADASTDRERGLEPGQGPLAIDAGASRGRRAGGALPHRRLPQPWHRRLPARALSGERSRSASTTGRRPTRRQFVTMLEREHTRATFFMIGEQLERDVPLDAAARAARRGRARRPHLHPPRTHDQPRRARAAASARSRSIRALSGYTPCVFRPPTATTTSRSCRPLARSGWRRCCGTSTRATTPCRGPRRSSQARARAGAPRLDHHLPRRRRPPRARRSPPTRRSSPRCVRGATGS